MEGEQEEEVKGWGQSHACSYSPSQPRHYPPVTFSEKDGEKKLGWMGLNKTVHMKAKELK